MATISQRNRANVLIHGAAVAASAASGSLAFIALDTPILTGIYIGLGASHLCNEHKYLVEK
jgi:hypothetical protein